MISGDAMIRVHRRGNLPAGLASPDVSFLPAYGRAASAADGGEWILLEAFGGAWQVPLAEQLTASLASTKKGRYVSVRFGNVLGSRGSVVHAFAAQIEAVGRSR